MSLPQGQADILLKLVSLAHNSDTYSILHCKTKQEKKTEVEKAMTKKRLDKAIGQTKVMAFQLL